MTRPFSQTAIKQPSDNVESHFQVAKSRESLLRGLLSEDPESYFWTRQLVRLMRRVSTRSSRLSTR